MAPTRSTLRTTPTSQQQHEDFYRCRNFLRGRILREGLGYSDDAEALRAELYETKLKLFSTQLAYEDLAFSVVGSPHSRFCRLDSSFDLSCTNLCPNHEDLFTRLQQLQSTVESQTVRINQLADSLLRSSLVIDPSKPPGSLTKNIPSGSRKIHGHDEHNTQAPISASEEEELDELKILITAAHNDDASALAKVRGFKRIAEQTPRCERSAGQKFLLNTWMKPRLRELFVDASGDGIGVVLEGKWLAWRFVIGHPDLPKGPDGRVDSSWAELIAAEMGVRTLLAARYSYVPVTLRSDNDPVVKALKAREWKKVSKLDDIVQEIFALTDKVGLDLRPDRVNGKENPADKPSRREYWRDLAFCPRPPIPSHLSNLIQEVECVE